MEISLSRVIELRPEKNDSEEPHKRNRGIAEDVSQPRTRKIRKKRR